MTLHILSTSPWDGSAFADCLRAIVTGDALMLAGDGVNAAWPGSGPAERLGALGAGVRVYVIADDCAQRGLDALPPAVRATDYAGFVQLAVEHARSVSWF